MAHRYFLKEVTHVLLAILQKKNEMTEYITNEIGLFRVCLRTETVSTPLFYKDGSVFRLVFTKRAWAACG